MLSMDRCHFYQSERLRKAESGGPVDVWDLIWAGRGVIWLVEEDKTTVEGFAAMERINKKILDAQSGRPLRFDFYEPDFELDETPNWNSEQSLPLHNILKRSWFSRMWILQEASVVGAAPVLGGKHTMPWSTIDGVYSYLGIVPWQDLELDSTFVETMKTIYGNRDEGLVLKDRSKYFPLLACYFWPASMEIHYFSAAGQPRVMVAADDDPFQLYIIEVKLAVTEKV